MSLMTRFLDPKNDYAFKQVFGRKKHKDILIHFLNDVLKLEGDAAITDVEFISPIQDSELASKKQSIVDVMCRERNGRQFIVEMQVARTSGFKERAMYYASKAYISQMMIKGKYEHLKEVIFIAIMDYELFPEKINFHSSHTLCDQETHEEDLKGFRFVFLELPRFEKTLEDLLTPVDKWCYFFKHAPQTTPEQFRKLIDQDTILKEAYEALNRAYWDDNDLLLYEQEMKSEHDELAILRFAKQTGLKRGLKKGLKKGLKEGREEGRTEERLTLAKKMLDEKLDISLIAKLTGLTTAEVESMY